MGNKSKTLSDPLVVNVNGELMAAVASLKKRFGLSNLSIVMKNGKYFLDVDGQLIEITFVNGKIIPADVFENLSARLAALLEQNGFEPLTLNELPTAAISQEELEQGLALFSFASIGMLAHNQNDRSDRTFELESIKKNAQNDTIVLDYNQRLNQNIEPTPVFDRFA